MKAVPRFQEKDGVLRLCKPEEATHVWLQFSTKEAHNRLIRVSRLDGVQEGPCWTWNKDTEIVCPPEGGRSE